MPMWNLEDAWEQRWCPIVPGLLFPDGSVVPFAPGTGGDGAPVPGSRTRLTDLAGGQPVPWTTIEPLARAVAPDLALIAAAGDGGRDGDGFVALIGGPLGALVWLAFFDDSGPFQEVRFDDDAVVARTAAGRAFRFPLASPERVVVTGP
jgi:hypothetical protein